MSQSLSSIGQIIGAFVATGLIQRDLLGAALDLVKAGGTVVYATCSLLDEENNAVVDAVIGARRDTKRIKGRFDGYLVPPESDGFFIATLQKQA